MPTPTYPIPDILLQPTLAPPMGTNAAQREATQFYTPVSEQYTAVPREATQSYAQPGVEYTAAPRQPGPRWHQEQIHSKVVGGLPVADPTGTNVLTQWMDTPYATAWIAEANRLLDAPASEFVSAFPDAETVRIEKIVQAIANACNAMNIPWYQDPDGRALWRQFFAGPPEDLTAEFSPSRNYNRNWYKADALYPQTEATAGAPVGTHTGAFGGTVTRTAQEEFQRSYPDPTRAPTHPSEFRPMAGVYMDVQDPETGGRRDDIRTSQTRINRGFTYPALTRGLLPWQGASFTSASVPAGLDGNHLSLEAALYCVPPAPSGSCETAGSNTLRFVAAAGVGAAGEWNPSVPLPLWARLETYMPWLRAWVASLVRRQPYQIVLDARRFAIVQTMQSIAAADGSVQNFLAGVALSRTSVYDQEHAHDSSLQIAATVAGALGAAIGTVTAGVGTVVGAAVAAGLLLVDAVDIGHVQGIGKDDLGRYKPVLDKGWLDGDPFKSDPSGMPSSRLVIPEPPGFVRPPRWEYPPTSGPLTVYSTARRDLAARLRLPRGVEDLPSIAALSFAHAAEFTAMPDAQMFSAFQREYCQLPPGGLRTQADVNEYAYRHPWCPLMTVGAGVSRTGLWIAVAAVAIVGGYAGYRLLSGRSAPSGGRRAGDQR